MKRVLFVLVVLAMVASLGFQPAQAAPTKNLGINVVLSQAPDDAMRAELSKFGKINGEMPELKALTMRADLADLPAIRALPFVLSANPDAERQGVPIDLVQATDFSDGRSTWNLDAINATEFPYYRATEFDGSGVYIAVLDTGLQDTWRAVFPEERIAVEYAKSFGGGGGERGNVSEQPNKWEHDQNGHGTHVTSTILGYQIGTAAVNGVAPMVKIIPVKVLNQNGSGWSSVIARGITYVADLKNGPLADYPVVINMSLGGSALDAVEKAAIDYAIASGVLIVASAGNSGEAGMGYPGAYEPVISVAASGWRGQWTSGGWWLGNVADPTDPNHFFIADFSSRALEGQDLDVTAPGVAIVGPYKLNSGNTQTYYYLSGTSMASPHVAGIVALMAQKYPALNNAMAEQALEASAIYMAPGCKNAYTPYGQIVDYCWGANATGAGLATVDAALAAIP